MSYFAQTVSGKIIVPKENLDKAFAVVQKYLGVNDADIEAEDVEDYVITLGFDTDSDEEGNLLIFDYADNYRDVEDDFSVLAPFVTPSSRLAWVGEDGTIFTWTFVDGELNDTTFDPDNLFD